MQREGRRGTTHACREAADATMAQAKPGTGSDIQKSDARITRRDSILDSSLFSFSLHLYVHKTLRLQNDGKQTFS
jgi:hypothetical protein